MPSLSPFHWAFATEPLHTGFDWGGLALLTGVTVVFFGLAWAGFERRDLRA